MDTNENSQTLNSFIIRRCMLNDEDAALKICLKTGNSGQDATSHFDDSNILGYRYVSPYIHLSNELSFVLQDSEKNVQGYVLAALDSKNFYEQYVNKWLPNMKQRYPAVPPEENGKQDRGIIYGFHNQQSFKLFDEFPSHLHIDLLPTAQGKGWGTKMIQHIEAELGQRGSKGVHLEMAMDNARALRFYTKLGFTILDKSSDTLWLGKTIA